MLNVLFVLTPGFSLGKWKRLGIFDREIAPYLNYIKKGNRLTILECCSKLRKPVRYIKG